MLYGDIFRPWKQFFNEKADAPNSFWHLHLAYVFVIRQWPKTPIENNACSNTGENMAAEVAQNSTDEIQMINSEKHIAKSDVLKSRRNPTAA